MENSVFNSFHIMWPEPLLDCIITGWLKTSEYTDVENFVWTTFAFPCFYCILFLWRVQQESEDRIKMFISLPLLLVTGWPSSVP